MRTGNPIIIFYPLATLFILLLNPHTMRTHSHRYDNDSGQDFLESVARMLSSLMPVEHVWWPHRPTQLAYMGHCAHMAAQQCEWVTFFDIDEFVCVCQACAYTPCIFFCVCSVESPKSTPFCRPHFCLDTCIACCKSLVQQLPRRSAHNSARTYIHSVSGTRARARGGSMTRCATYRPPSPHSLDWKCR